MLKTEFLKNLGEKIIHVRFVGRMLVRPEEFIGRYLFVHGAYEEDLLRLFSELVRPGDCVLDIGANLGYFTLLASRLVREGGKVHAFEASCKTFDRLAANLALNSLQNVVLHHCAVSDCRGMLDFFDARDTNSGLSSLRDLGELTREVTRVNAITIDSLLADLATVRLVKLDVEGAECLALHGMAGLLRRDRPYLTLEMSDAFLRELGSSSDEVYHWLTDAGYTVYRIAPRLCRMHQGTDEQCNVLCIPNGIAIPKAITAILD
jgi:FkbM family methyltransferase